MKITHVLARTAPAFLAFGATILLAQVPQLHPTHAALAPAQAAAKEAAPPALSQAEGLHIENIQLKMTILRQQEMQLQQEYESTIDAIQREHPGYTVNRQTNQLIALPKPEPTKPASPNADKK
jgi:hypothetical protein